MIWYHTKMILIVSCDTIQKMILIVNYTRIQFDTWVNTSWYGSIPYTDKKHNINRQVIEVYHTNKNINNTWVYTVLLTKKMRRSHHLELTTIRDVPLKCAFSVPQTRGQIWWRCRAFSFQASPRITRSRTELHLNVRTQFVVVVCFVVPWLGK